MTAQQLKEKEEQIAELLAEGEKLSKQELKQSNVIKKLREKEKDLEKQLDGTRYAYFFLSSSSQTVM